MEEEKPKLTEEQEKKLKVQLDLQIKIARVSKEIGEILKKEGLDLYVSHNIRIVPFEN